MIPRQPLEHGVFEDIEVARRYDKETRMRGRYVAKSFVTVAKRWGIAAGKILDVGTGTGLLAIEFAKSIPDVEVVGLDLSDVVLQLARDSGQSSEVASRVVFEHGDAEDMPFGDDTFDLVISSNTLHLIENPVRMFDEIQRVLKPAGRFFISDFRRSWLAILTKHIRASYSPTEVEGLLRQSKLRNWEVQDRLLWLNILSSQ
jgi:ubiquinone/menaquinone biosynthesis C-methylase UbiE